MILLILQFPSELVFQITILVVSIRSLIDIENGRNSFPDIRTNVNVITYVTYVNDITSYVNAINVTSD